MLIMMILQRRIRWSFAAALLILFSMTGCGSYTAPGMYRQSATVDEGFYWPQVRATRKLPFKVALVADQGFMQQRLSVPNDSGQDFGVGRTDMQLQPAMTEAILSTLSADFTQATVVGDPSRSSSDLLIYPNVQFTWWQASSSNLPTISNSTELTIKDRQTGEVVEYFRHEAASDDPGRRTKDQALSAAEDFPFGFDSNTAEIIEIIKRYDDADSSKTTVERVLAANLDAISAQILGSRALEARANHPGQLIAQQAVASPVETTTNGGAPAAAVKAAPNSITQPSHSATEMAEATSEATFPVVEKNARRLALIIGNSKYEHVAQLPNPASDARLVAGTLQRLGFKLMDNGPLVDLDKDAFERVLQEFGNEVQGMARNGSTIALFYYAGHGMQVNGVNYLVPVSADPTKVSDVPLQMVSADAAMSQMEDAGASLKIMILDACRNNPFVGISRSLGGGLAGMDAPDGTLIAYATKPNAVAVDGAGRDSPYTEALVEAVQKPGLGLFDVFNETALIVERKTDNAQQPWQAESAIEGRFCFAGCAD
jgi:hypothetical protein